MSTAVNPLGRKTQRILLQAARAVPWRHDGFAIRPEHIGKLVWILPEQPTRQRYRGGWSTSTRRANLPSHAVVVEHDGSVWWPKTRAAPRGSLELQSKFRRFTLPRVPAWETNRTEHVKPLLVGTVRIHGRFRYARLVLSGDWLMRAGFPVGTAVLREVVKPGVLVLRVVPPVCTALVAEQTHDARAAGSP